MTDTETLKDARKWLNEDWDRINDVAIHMRALEGERLIQWLLDYIEDMELPQYVPAKRPNKWKMFMGWLFG